MTDALTVVSGAAIEKDAKIAVTHQAVAMSAQDMMRAQITVKDFLGAKLVGLDAEIAEVQATYEAAVKHKWKSSTFLSQLSRLKAKRLYYGKLLAACEAGYTVVPNMDCAVFAIRVKREKPVEWDQGQPMEYEHNAPHLRDEEEQRLPVGEGRYENPKQTVRTTEDKFTDPKTGKLMRKMYAEAVDFCDLEFPLAVATPMIMDATTAAMQAKIFDRIGVVIGKNQTVRERKGDPLVIGQIRMKEGYGYKTASFLIAWYLDPRTL